MAAPVDHRRLEVIGTPVQIEPAGFEKWFDVSSTGTLVYGTIGSADAEPDTATLVWVDRGSGRETPSPFGPRHYSGSGVRLSPDGTKVAVAIADTTPEPGDNEAGRLWIGDLRSGQLTPLTTTDAQPIAWTPDGTRVVFINSRGALASKPIYGTETEDELAGPEHFPMGGCTWGSWSRDAQTLIIRCHAPGLSGDLLAVSLPSDRRAGVSATVRPFVTTPFGEGHPVVSPDGHWVAYQSSEGGQQDIWVKGFPSGLVQRVTTGGGNMPFWRGRELFYLGLSPRVPMVMPVLRIDPAPEFGEARPAVGPFDYGQASGFDVSPDGQRFLVLKGARHSGATQINVVVNWIEEVRRKIAAGR